MFGYKHVVTQVFTTVLTCNNCSSHYYSLTNSAYNKQVIQSLQINISIWATAHLPPLIQQRSIDNKLELMLG